MGMTLLEQRLPPSSCHLPWVGSSLHAWFAFENHVLSLCIWAWKTVRRQSKVSRSLESKGLLGTLQNFPISWEVGCAYCAVFLVSCMA